MYDLILLVFISRKLQLSSIVRILFLCPVPNQLQSRGVSLCIVTHLQALSSIGVTAKIMIDCAGAFVCQNNAILALDRTFRDVLWAVTV